MFLANWWKIFAKSSIHNAGKKLAVEEDEQVFFCCVILAILMISSSPLMAKDALHNEIIQFDIPRQQADMSLIKFAEQADLTLIVPFDQVRKITTNRLVCRYPIKEALEILLSGTGLTANVGDSIRITLYANGQSQKSRIEELAQQRTSCCERFSFKGGDICRTKTS